MSSQQKDPIDIALQMHRIAFERLTFQDEYLFKFGTVMLLANGGLAVAAQSAFHDGKLVNHALLLSLTGTAAAICGIWRRWVVHNDYWHSVWIGVLRDIEGSALRDAPKVFATDDAQMAKGGHRLPNGKGHDIAESLPIALAIAWILAFTFTAVHWAGSA